MTRRRFIKTGLIFCPWLVLPHDLVRCSSFLPIPTMDDEAYRWAYSRVPAVGSVSARTIVAVDTFLKSWKRYGLRGKTARLSLCCGNDLATSMAAQIIDAGTTFDSNNFGLADYSEATGITGNGSNENITTGLNPNTAASTDSIHMGCYVRSKTTDVGVIMGTNHSGVGELAWLVAYGASNVTTFALYNEVGPPYYDDSASGVGYYLSSRIASNDAKGYKNGVQILATTTPTGGIPAPNNLLVHCWNDNTLSSQAFTSRTIAGYHFGTGFTATDAANAFKCWDAFNRTLGRNV